MEALLLDANNFRGLQRAGECAIALADWDEAEMAWTKALEVDPHSTHVRNSLKKLSSKRVEYQKKQKAMWGGKLAKGLEEDTRNNDQEATPATVREAKAHVETRTEVERSTEQVQQAQAQDEGQQSQRANTAMEKQDKGHPNNGDVGWRPLVQLAGGLLLVYLLTQWNP